MALNWSEALAWRMRQQMLDPIGKESVEAVVKRLAAVQSSAAELSIRARQLRSSSGEVDRALVEGHLIKTFAFRGATHFMTPEDAGIYLALRASSRMWELPSWQKFYKLKPSDWPDLRKAVREALADGPKTKAELKVAVTAHRQFKHLGFAFSDDAKTLLKPLAWLGEMSFGSPRDGKTTFQRLDRNPRWSGIPNLEIAGPKAIEDYLRTYGPATAKHLRYWLGESLGAVRLIRSWLASLSDRLALVEIKGSEAYVLRENLEQLMSTPKSNAVRLLPAYDQWVMGPGISDTNIVPAKLRPLISRGANPVIVAGRVLGTWSVAGDAVTIAWSDQRKPPKEQLAKEIERLSTIKGRRFSWTIERQ
jgi:hypothetical protein